MASSDEDEWSDDAAGLFGKGEMTIDSDEDTDSSDGDVASELEIGGKKKIVFEEEDVVGYNIFFFLRVPASFRSSN